MWFADLERTRLVQCLTATNTLRESSRHLEVHSRFMLGRKSERLATEMSLMEKRSILNAQLHCVEVCDRNVLCEFLSLRDIAKRFLFRAAQDAVHVSASPAPGIEEN